MGRKTSLSRRAFVVLVVAAATLGVCGPAGALNMLAQSGGGAAAQLQLLDVTENPNVNRTTYSYGLKVSDPSILHVGESTLTLRHMAGVRGIGNAIGWRRHSFTDSTGRWQYHRQLAFRNYSTFDIEVDNDKTQPGVISYHLYADQETFGTVAGPVAIDLGETYQVSGTVFLDADGDGVFDAETEHLTPRVSLSLQKPNGTEVASVVSNGGSYNGSSEYLGNYVFDGIERGPYKIVVTDFLGVLDGLTLTTGKTPYSVAVHGDVRHIDFGYAYPD